MRRRIALVWTLLLGTPLIAQEPNLKVPPGFKVTLYADHTLANDIFSMTLDERGDVIVSSRGWVKRLVDTDGDGKADKAEKIASTTTGAMGLCVDNHELYFTADGWFQWTPLVRDRFDPKVATLGAGEVVKADRAPANVGWIKGRYFPRLIADPLDGQSMLSSEYQMGSASIRLLAAPVHPPSKWKGHPNSITKHQIEESVDRFLTTNDRIIQSTDTWYSKFLHAQDNPGPIPVELGIGIFPGDIKSKPPQDPVVRKPDPIPSPPTAPREVPERPAGQLIPIAFSEHGGHAMRKGPDGCWYLIYGNSSNIENVKLDPSSPIRKPEAGGILRFSRDLKKVECIAQGFRNPYDFDFTPLGDIITYDSDTERDFLMPWYSPTRFYHVAHAQHHGWRLPGYMQSLARRDYYADTVDVLAPIGRGSPTGVTCYRHYQFPKRYRGGVFACDWTFGKIYFVPLEADGSSYKTKPEVFLESTGTEGFAPTDICVAPDGSLFVSIGGRGTRGAVYHIEYVGTPEEPAGMYEEPKSIIDQVLTAPQPLDSWSRAIWEPRARRISRDLANATCDPRRPWQERVRTIEVMVELFPDDLGNALMEAMNATEWQIRARVAWAMSHDKPGYLYRWMTMLHQLARDRHPSVRVAALNSMGEVLPLALESDWYRVEDAAVLNLDHADKRVRLAACGIVPKLWAGPWLKMKEAVESKLRARLMFSIADHRETGQSDLFPIERLRTAVEGLQSDDRALHLDALRLLMLIDGDWCVHNPPDDVSAAYYMQKARTYNREIDGKIREQLLSLYPSGDRNFDLEASRYLAMVEDASERTIGKVLTQITPDSDAVDDVHHLIVLSRLKGVMKQDAVTRTVDALLGLEKKLGGRESRIKQTWGPRLGEIVFNLMLRQPKVAETMLAHPNFARASHVALIRPFATDSKLAAAKLFLKAIEKDPAFPWSPELVDLLAELPSDQHKPLFRKQWDDYSLRDAILPYMLDTLEERDRPMILDSLDSPRKEIVLQCIAALNRLERDDNPKNLVPVMRRLRQGASDPKEKEIRDGLLALVLRQSLISYSTAEATVDWFERTYPAETKLLRGDDEDFAPWKKVLDSVDWNKGDAEKGMKIFQQRSCAACHTGSSRIGPDLAGVAGRFSRDDLFTAIISPSRDVAPAYRVNEIETKAGLSYSGIVVFESADGVIMQLDAVKTVRIASGDIAMRRLGRKSLMPSGLLRDLKPTDLADLHAYLRSL